METTTPHETLQSAAVTFGRFNLLHKGHIDLFTKMSCYGTVYIGLSSAKGNLDAEARKAVILKALQPGVEAGLFEHGVKVIIAHQPFEVFEIVANEIGSEVTAFFGTDQDKLATSASRAFGWDKKVIERLTSSTAVRALIDAEEWDCLEQIVPGKIIRDIVNLRLIERNQHA